MLDGWHRVPLGEVATQEIEPFDVDPGGQYINLGVQWYAHGVFARPPKRGSEMKATRLFRVRPGQFIYNRMFVTEGSFGVVRDEHAAGVVSNEFPVFAIDSARMLTDYLALYFQQPQVWKRAADEATGTTKSRRRWKESQFLAHIVAVPSLDEQRRIVDLIAEVDGAIEAADAEAEAADRTMGAVIEASIERDASPTMVLGDAATIVRGGSPRPIAAFETEDEDGYPWIKIGDIAADGKYVTTTAKKIKPSGLNKTRVVNPGDFILSNSMSFGRPYIVQITGCIHDGWLALSDYGLTFDSEYLYFLLRSSAVQSQFNELAAGSGVRNLKKESVASVKVKAPGLESQRAIVARAAAAAELRDAARATRDALRELRADLLTALLSGEHQIPSSYGALVVAGAA